MIVILRQEVNGFLQNTNFRVPSITLPLAILPDRLIGLPEGRARNHNRPQQIPVLAGVVIEDVAVGAEHTLALASTGDVYAWGSNSEGQVNGIFAALAYSRNLTVLFICKSVFVF
jgi:hypothetical protein